MLDETKLTWKTERRRVKDLIPYDLNPRKISGIQKEKLKESLSKFDLVEIPVINTDNKIIAGHQRVAILFDLGRSDEEIEVRVPSRLLSEKEFKEYLLRSNKNTGDWEFESLINFEEDMLRDVGFSSQEIDNVFKDEEGETEQFDLDLALNNIKEPVAQLGDLFQLGKHRVLCGDATREENVARLMNGEKAQMIFTDPPYNVNYTGKTKDALKIQNDKMEGEDFSGFIKKVFINIFKNVAGSIYVCMSTEEFGRVKDIFVNLGGHWSSTIIWVKSTFALSRKDWHPRYEPILYGWKEGGPHFFSGVRTEDDVWEGLEKVKAVFDGTNTIIDVGDFHLQLEGEVKGKVLKKDKQQDIWFEKKPSRNKEHPTMKPIKLVEKAICASSIRGGVVLDVFGGSGTTLLAAENQNRVCYMMEYDPKYVDVIIKRWEEQTGLKAIKID